MHLTQVGGAQLDVLVRVQHLLGRCQRNAEFSGGFFGCGWHQLHQAARAHAGTRVIHKGTFLTGDGEYPTGMQAAHLGLAHQGVAVRHREADVQIVPILRLTDGANGREIPFAVVGQFGLRHHFVAIEVAADVIPLTAAIDDLPAVMKFQCALYAGGVAHFVNQLRAEHQRFVVELIRGLRPIGCQEAVEITFAGHIFEQHLRLRIFRFGQLQAARLPVAPAVAGGQILRQLAGQLIGIFPACQAQQQAQAPFGDGVVAQLGVIFGHDVQAAAVIAAGERQTNLTGDGDLFIP